VVRGRLKRTLLGVVRTSELTQFGAGNSQAVGPEKTERRKSYAVRCASMALQAASASANILKGDPPTLIAGLLIMDGAPRSYKARLAVRSGAIATLVTDYERKAAFGRAPYL
jgi:hypothetical protein